MRWTGLVPALVAGLVATTPVIADEGEEEARYLAPTVTGETGLFTLITAQTLPKGKWSFGIYYNNWDRMLAPSLSFPDPPFDNEWDVDWNRLSASVGYGISDRFELSVMAPFEAFEASGDGKAGALNGHGFFEDIDASGFGNVRLSAHARIVGEHDAANILGLYLFGEAPTGDDDEGVVTGDPGFGAGLAYTHRKFTLNFGLRDPGDSDEQDVSAEATAGVGFAHDITERFDWITELVGTLYLDSDAGPDDDIDISTGGRLWLGESEQWAFNFALRINATMLGDTDEFCPIGGLVGLTFHPRAKIKKEEEKKEEVKVEAPPPPKPTPPPPAPPPKAEIREVCEFKAGSVRVDNICKARLDEVALKMKQDTSLKATVTGYSFGAAEAADMKTSKLRAENTKKYLMDRHKIDGSRIVAEGRGSAEPSHRVVIVLKSE